MIQHKHGVHRQVCGFILAAIGLSICFSPILVQLGRFALTAAFDSYLILIPAIAAGMIWARWEKETVISKPNRSIAAALITAGIVAFGFYWAAANSSGAWSASRLTLATLSFVLFIAGVAAWFLGRRIMATVAFPLGFLFCMVPLPASFTANLEYFLQHASASLANVGFQISDLPVFQRSDLIFQLPGITLEVAPECSGIQSTVALFIVSLAAGYILLRSPWKRAVLCLTVIPLGILRNAVRIVTIGELCVHIGPDMINSYIHRKGGWIFFLVTLVPFLALLLFFGRSEHALSKNENKTEGNLC